MPDSHNVARVLAALAALSHRDSTVQHVVTPALASFWQQTQALLDSKIASWCLAVLWTCAAIVCSLCRT
jgi:hypothetical protein